MSAMHTTTQVRARHYTGAGAGLRKTLLLLASLMLFPAAHAMTPLDPSQSAQQWLSHMAQSVRELNYRGRSILMNDDQMNSVEIIHGVIDGEPWERVIHLTGEPAEILRRGDKVTCLHPNKLARFQTSASGTPHKPLSAASADKALRYYVMSKTGSDRVAGRDARRVDVMPRDRNRYGYQFWLDAGSGLMLKSVTVDHNGRGLEVFEFVSIDVGGEITRGDFEPGESLRAAAKSDAAAPMANDQLPWQLGWLPAGFELTQQEMRRVGEANTSTKVYSDGLAAFSVFFEKVDSDAQVEGSRSHGATTALSRRMAEPHRDYLVTVVGEIPMETAMQIAVAVSLEK